MSWTTFLKSTFIWWKSSRSRLVADDVINEQISLELWLKHLVHRYEIWHSTAHMTIAPITAYLYQFLRPKDVVKLWDLVIK